MTDKDYLRQAIEIGNQIPPPYNFGAVVVRNGQVIAAEHNHVHDFNDPSLHSEISAITTACKKQGSNHIDGAILYCSHEPCIMCFSCAAWAHIDRIVYCTSKEEQDDSMYEFKNVKLADLAQQLLRPIKVQRIDIN